MSGVTDALRHECARRSGAAHHEDPHRSASLAPILVKPLRGDNHSFFRGGGSVERTS
jgi:hypothetical protein